ncbi:MAG TPA: ATP synthase F1 subunit epsilon [Thermoleophilia bacterium]|nr:ATP synthase F1 subunit epsilon [Thermoleophilia bacterium]
MADERTLQVEIVTPDGSVYDGEAVMVVVPGVEGELGLLARHEPLVSLVAIGDSRLQVQGGEWHHFATGIGYVQVLFDKVLLVVDHAEEADRIDVARAEAALKRAEERLDRRADPGAQAEVDFYKAEQALHRAENRLKVAARG